MIFPYEKMVDVIPAIAVSDRFTRWKMAYYVNIPGVLMGSFLELKQPPFLLK